MTSIQTPDLSPPRRFVISAAVVIVSAWTLLAVTHGEITRTLGDTDDAMRLVRVRALLAGQGWFDQAVARLQPPLGSMMHWSRLLDGALAGAIWLVSRIASPGAAEWAVRFAWPLLWIAPAVVCALSIVRRLGGRSAVLVGALLLVLDVQLYAQFRPGRVDHHNIQIVMTLAAAAAVMARERRVFWAAIAGAASALGLAIGIEALAFHALIGAAVALRLAFDPQEAAAARAYGLSLATVALLAFGAQTPPALWTTSACDALALNLLAALVIGGLGLAGLAGLAAQAGSSTRLVLLAGVGGVAAAVYLALDPACLHGPLAHVDPRLRPIWLDRIQEMRPWPALWRLDRGAAWLAATMAVFGLAGALALTLRREGRRDPAMLLALSLVALATAASFQAYRLTDYLFWFGVPVLAAAISRLVDARFGGALVSALFAGFLLAPENLATAAARAPAPSKTPAVVKTGAAQGTCLSTPAYQTLGKLPPGLVAAPIDLGPFILANTPSSALSAPYHRMGWGIWAAHKALNTSPADALARLQGLGVRYVVDCPSDASDPDPRGLMAGLRRGQVPVWLRVRSAPHDALQVYELAPIMAKSR